MEPNLSYPEDLLNCVDCGSALKIDDPLTCSACGRTYGWCRGRPVLMSKDNPLFPPEDYEREEGGRSSVLDPSLLSRIKRAVPSRSINIARDRMLTRIATENGNRTAPILVIGCGHQRSDVMKYFEGKSTRFVFCDIDKAADADFFCDSHELPFRDGSFSGVITTAVLEHVLRPHRVSVEIHRVLELDGFVYSEIPFLQAVHEGAYDFTRFTLGGHRLLFDYFDELDSGVVAGPGTALTWALVEYFRSLSSNRRLSSALGMIAQTAFFWVKYTDLWTASRPRARDAASCTYFYGRSRKTQVSSNDIIARYGETNFSHT